jgi:hypothetical protein
VHIAPACAGSGEESDHFGSVFPCISARGCYVIVIRLIPRQNSEHKNCVYASNTMLNFTLTTEDKNEFNSHLSCYCEFVIPRQNSDLKQHTATKKNK